MEPAKHESNLLISARPNTCRSWLSTNVIALRFARVNSTSFKHAVYTRLEMGVLVFVMSVD